MNRRLAYAQLLRIPNVFTAIADVCIGLLFTRPPTAIWACLIAASACLYSAGIAWNDFFDRRVDARERPARPIPSGRVSPRLALWLALALSVVGLAAAVLAWSWHDGGTLQPILVASILLACILAYDGGMKKTPIGPLVMGSCRLLNVLLGFSMMPFAVPAWSAAVIVGVYIAGVTVMARDEAGRSRRSWLAVGTVVVGAALTGALAMPLLNHAAGRDWMIPVIIAFATTLGVVIAKAVRQPSPPNVQAVIKSAILGVIVLDAGLATSLAGPVGLLLLALLIPARVLGRWVYST